MKIVKPVKVPVLTRVVEVGQRPAGELGEVLPGLHHVGQLGLLVHHLLFEERRKDNR
jgi:hypothetical protein